jgi:hypothetical protein
LKVDAIVRRTRGGGRKWRRKHAECRKEGKKLAEEEGEQGRLSTEP